MEIIIRFFTTNYPEIYFVLVIFFFQTQFNNSFNATTGLSINEFSYGFEMRETFSNFTEPEILDLPAQRLKYRQGIAAFVNVKTNINYDVYHMPLFLDVDDQLYLKLYHGYGLPGRFNKKNLTTALRPVQIYQTNKTNNL